MKETEAVLNAAAAAITKDPCLPATDWRGLDWNRVYVAAVRNKLADFIEPLFRSEDLGAPAVFVIALQAHVRSTLQTNGRNLQTIRRVGQILGQGGMQFAFFKGPLLQKRLYGSYFSKPASDVDVLVQRRQYDAAAAALAQAEFKLAIDGHALWWKQFLGEQPFRSSGREFVTVDLHWRMQQPGLPLPWSETLFFDEVERATVGEAEIPTLSLENAFLVACISVAKALFNKEPAGSYAADIAAVLHAEDFSLPRALRKAHANGLANTVALGLRAARLLFHASVHDAPKSLESVADEDLVKMLAEPWAPEIKWVRRTPLLWELLDRKADFAGEVLRRGLSDAVRHAHA